MPIVWEGLWARDHTRRAKRNVDLRGAAGEGSRGESTESFCKWFPSTSRSYLPSPSSCTTHTNTFSLFVYQSQSFCFLFQSPFENQWPAAVLLLSWSHVEMAFPWLQTLPALLSVCMNLCVRLCASAGGCKCMFVVFFGRSKEKCGRTFRQGNKEDNNSSKKHTCWLQLAEL